MLKSAFLWVKLHFFMVLLWVKNFLLGIPKFLHVMFIVALQELGLTSLDDLLNQVFFLKYKFMALSVLIFSVGTGVLIQSPFITWFETWVYAPYMIFFICLSVTVSEWATGIMNAVIFKGEKFDLIKGASIVPKIISQGWALTTAFHFGSNEPLMAWLAPSVAIFLFTFNFLKTLYHASLMGWVPKELTEFLQEKFKLQNKTSNEPSDN